RRGDQFADRLRALGGGEIDGRRALAAIAGMIVGGRQVLAVMTGDEGRSPMPCVVAAIRVFDLDYVRAEVGEHLSGPWTGENAGEFDDSNAVKGRMGHQYYLGHGDRLLFA